MSIPSELRDGIAIIKGEFIDLMDHVTIRRWLAQDKYGKGIFTAPETFEAIIDLRQQDRPGASGQITRTSALVTILEEIAPINSAGRQNPIDPRDIIVLPDNTTAPIVETQGLWDGETNRPFYTDIWLGARRLNV